MNYFVDQYAGTDHIWIIGDEFAAKSIQPIFLKLTDEESFTKSNFEIKVVTNNRFSEWSNDTLSRIRNAFLNAAQNGKVIPKLITVIMEDDVIKRIGDQPELGLIYNKIINWLFAEFKKILESTMDLVAPKSKKEDNPYILWILATRHEKYPNDKKRGKFNDCLTSVGKLYSNNFTLDLKQLWDPKELSLYNPNEKKLTAYGLKTYWKSVDRTIKFCNSIIDRITAKKYLNRINNVSHQRPGNEQYQYQQTSSYRGHPSRGRFQNDYTRRPAQTSHHSKF